MVKKRFEPEDFFKNIDIPIYAFLGIVASFLSVGGIYSTAGIFLSRKDGEFLSLRSLIAGLICIAISIALLYGTYLYWKYIPKRFGALWPSLNGLGALVGILSFAMSAFALIKLSYPIITR